MILNIAGFSLSNWITYGFSFLSGPISWRFPLAFQLFFILILFLTVPWLPESPRWLIAHDRVDEGRNILADIEGRDFHEKEHAVPWSDLLRGRVGNNKAGTSTMRRLLLGVGTQVMQQLSGINVTSYYLPTVLISSVGLSNSLARLLAACNSVSYLLFSLLAIPQIERWGRRNLMMYCAAGQAVCYIFITALLRYASLPATEYSHQREVAAASVAFFFLFYGFFGIGWQATPWLYPTEINSLAMRTKGAGLGTAANWLMNFMVVEITPIGISSLGWRFYIIWIVFNASFVPIVYLFYPETSNRTLEDIDRLFRENGDIWVYRDRDAVCKRRPHLYFDREELDARMDPDGDTLVDWSRKSKESRSSGSGSSGVTVVHGDNGYVRQWD